MAVNDPQYPNEVGARRRAELSAISSDHARKPTVRINKAVKKDDKKAKAGKPKINLKQIVARQREKQALEHLQQLENEAKQGVSGRKNADLTAHKPLQPNTIDHFRAYTKLLVLDSGEYWEIEDFQCEVVSEVFNGVLETWAVIPEANAKTTLTAGLALYHADYVQDAFVCMAAASRDQVGVLFYQCAGFIWRTPNMEKRFHIRDAPRIIDAKRSNGRLKVYSADARTGDGVIPTLAILEELHRQKTLGLYRVWYGKLDKRGGQLLAISTAGDPASEFEIIREKLLVSASKTTIEGFHTRSEHESTVLHDWRVPEDADVSDPAVLKRANPLKAVTEEKLAAKIKSPTMTTAHIRRFSANQPTRGMDVAVNPLEWRDAGTDDRIPEGEPVACGLDLGWKWDTTGIVPIWLPDLENRLIDFVDIIEPPRDGTTLSPQVVKNAFWTIHKRNPIELVVMDEDRGAEIAEFLRNEIGCRVAGHSQSDPAMCLAYDRWMEALRNGWLRWSRKGRHAETLTTHINNAVTKLLPSGRARFERPSLGVRQGRNQSSNERNVIDGLIAACMVNSVAAANDKQQTLLDPSEFRVIAA